MNHIIAYETDWLNPSGPKLPVTNVDAAMRALAIIAVVCVAFWTILY